MWVAAILILVAGCKPKTEQKSRVYDLTLANIQYRFTAYGDGITRVQVVSEGQSYLPDNRYEMVEKHDWAGELIVCTSNKTTSISNGNGRFEIGHNGSLKYFVNDLLVLDSGSVTLEGDTSVWRFEHDTQEHFAGLGHDYTGRLEKLDLQGQLVRRNYGHSDEILSWEHSMQAPLIVPFYFSSKHYGIFLNSTFPNFFDFGSNGTYQFGIDDQGYEGQLDVFFMAGEDPKEILNHYINLTGKPRLPQMSVFGLQLSDKVHDHNNPVSSDENWWKKQVIKHRNAGFPLDHLVNDNRWRAGGGKRCESRIEWDMGRFPDPAAYKTWLDSMGLTITLDFNRCIAEKSEGWQPDFNIKLPEDSEFHEFPESNPDFTDPQVQSWLWKLFYDQALDPSLKYPGEGLWIDEVDALYTVSYDTDLHDGNWAEMANHWYLNIGKALIGNGWDQSDIEKRPYIWIRGLTAGAQRYGTMWSGDIGTNYDEMELQLRGMVSAGLSGVPFWGHDAGGFIDFSGDDIRNHPKDSLYARWSMQMGAFSPIWKPHGMGLSRWPLDRSKFSQEVARKYSRLRYELMPYTYSFAHQANQTGVPLTRAMFLNYPDQEEAWKNDLQYMWGEHMLIVPMFEASQRAAWIPDGEWYDFHSGLLSDKSDVAQLDAGILNMPIFVKAGAIIPTYEYALSTFFIDKTKVNLNVYTGADGEFELIEDDGVTEDYQDSKMLKTVIKYNASTNTLNIQKGEGGYEDMNDSRQITCIFYGVDGDKTITVNDGDELILEKSYDEENKTLRVVLSELGVYEEVVVRLE